MLSTVLLAFLSSCVLVRAVDGVISLDLQGRSSLASASSLVKRAALPSADAIDYESLGLLYFANVTVGTPPQSLGLSMIAYATETVVLGPDSCSANSTTGAGIFVNNTWACYGGTFYPNASSTYNVTSENVTILDTGLIGNTITETLGLSGVSAKGYPMSVATNASTAQFGWLGLGFPNDKNSTSILNYMVSQGLIAARLFSLWMDSYGTSSGNLLFGGIDRAKFATPALAALPLNASYMVNNEYAVTLGSVDIQTGANFTTDPNANFASILPLVGILYTNLPYNTVPTLIYSSLAKALGINTSLTTYPPCSTFDQPGRVRLGFGSPVTATIDMPFSQLAVRFTESNGTQSCAFAFADGRHTYLGNSTVSLGIPFLRSAYVVFDIDNKQLGVAQAVVNATSSNITSVPAGANSLIVAGSASTSSSATSASSSATKTGTATSVGTAAGTSAATAAATSHAGTSGLIESSVGSASIAVLGLVMLVLGGALV